MQQHNLDFQIGELIKIYTYKILYGYDKKFMLIYIVILGLGKFEFNPTRSNGPKLLKPICKIKPRTHDFFIRINYWNKLPKDICASFPAIFKKTIKHHTWYYLKALHYSGSLEYWSFNMFYLHYFIQFDLCNFPLHCYLLMKFVLILYFISTSNFS